MVENALQKHVKMLRRFAERYDQPANVKHGFAVYCGKLSYIGERFAVGGHKKFRFQPFRCFKAFEIAFQTVIIADAVFFQNMRRTKFIGGEHDIVGRAQSDHEKAVPGKGDDFKTLRQGSVLYRGDFAVFRREKDALQSPWRIRPPKRHA
jgi:hypothetical protein